MVKVRIIYNIYCLENKLKKFLKNFKKVVDKCFLLWYYMQAVCERQTLDSKKTEKSFKKLLTTLRSFGTIKLHPQKWVGQTEP